MSDGLIDLDELADQQGLPKTTAASQDLQEPATANETNDNIDGTSAEDNVDTEYTVIVNNEKITFSTDKWGSSLVDKLQGHGIHIQQNGDLIMLSGSSGKGKACGGRMLINTKGGQITKTGPTVVERTAASTSSIEGEGSTTTEDSSEAVAHSEVNYGDVEAETLGTHYIRAKNIVLDGVDSLTLRAGTQIVLDTGNFVTNASSVEENIGAEKKVVESQSENEIKEETSKQYDNRASKNIVGSGNVNQNIHGDYQLKVAGIMNMQIQGNKRGPQEALVRNRNVGLMIGLNASGNAGGLELKAKDLIKLGTTGSSFEVTANENVSLFATDDVDIQGMMNTNVLATDGKVTVKGQRVKVETTGGDIEIDAKMDVKVKGQKIYLN